MEIRFGVKKCQNYNSNECKKCGDYCITFDDNEPYKDFMYEYVSEFIDRIYISNIIFKKNVDLFKDNKFFTYDNILYLDDKMDIARIFPNTVYDFLCVETKGEMN